MTVLWIVGILLLALGMLLFLIFPAIRRHPDRQLLAGAYIAHRGLHDLSDGAPENSVPAFQNAIDCGYAIEIDIHLTADGEVVVFHDDDLERLCGVPGRIEDKTLEEVKALRLAGTEQTIPTLRECLTQVAGRVPLLIEFKCLTVKLCGQLCTAADALLNEYDGPYAIQSFFPFVLYWYRRHRREVCRGQLATAFIGESLARRLLGCMVFNVLARPDFVSYEHVYARRLFRRLCCALGALSVGWTFHTQDELERGRQSFCGYIFEGFIPRER